MKKELIYSLDTLDNAVEELYKLFENYRVFTFTGTLGAGKTTLVQALLRRCGVTEHIVSPTFMYVIEYKNSKKEIFYHFDLYRMHSASEFVDMGFDEYIFADNSWSFIEWPQVIAPILKNNKICSVFIDFEGTDQRKLVYSIE